MVEGGWVVKGRGGRVGWSWGQVVEWRIGGEVGVGSEVGVGAGWWIGGTV